METRPTSGGYGNPPYEDDAHKGLHYPEAVMCREISRCHTGQWLRLVRVPPSFRAWPCGEGRLCRMDERAAAVCSQLHGANRSCTIGDRVVSLAVYGVPGRVRRRTPAISTPRGRPEIKHAGRDEIVRHGEMRGPAAGEPTSLSAGIACSGAAFAELSRDLLLAGPPYLDTHGRLPALPVRVRAQGRRALTL